MSRTDPQMRIRLPAELKKHIEDAAKAAGRSMNAEIVKRLSESIDAYASANKVADEMGSLIPRLEALLEREEGKKEE